MKLQMLMLIAAIWCATVTATSGAEKSRVWKVSDAAGLIAAVSEMPAEGGMITLEPGTYEITEPLVFKAKSQVNIEGSGWSTVIKKKGDGDAIVFTGSCWNCRVHSMTIQGDKDAKKGSGIVYREGEWSGINVVDYVHIDYFPESGIRYEGSPKTPFSSNTISNCWLTNNLGDQIYSAYNNDFYMYGNQMGRGPGRQPRSGTLLDHSSAGTYTMNYHWGNTVALRLVGSHFNRIENNRFEESQETGILIGNPPSIPPCQGGTRGGWRDQPAQHIHRQHHPHQFRGQLRQVQRGRGPRRPQLHFHQQSDLQLGIGQREAEVGDCARQELRQVDHQGQYHPALHRQADSVRSQGGPYRKGQYRGLDTAPHLSQAHIELPRPQLSVTGTKLQVEWISGEQATSPTPARATA
jgi:hypothetical protein